MTRRRSEIEQPGQDSFLDVVCNLVGILLIMIMVVGTRATKAMVDVAEDQRTEQPLVDVATPQKTTAAMERDVQELIDKIQQEQLEVAFRRRERDLMLLAITAQKTKLDGQRSQLSQDQQNQLALQAQLDRTRHDLATVQRSLQAIENTPPPVEVIRHMPTPLAKTVFGKEVHFQLSEDRVAHVPWDELVDQLQQDAPRKAWKLKDAPRVAETLGPVRGFRMDYILRRGDRTVETQQGVLVQKSVELEQFVLVPIEPNLGEPVTEALREGSYFLRLLNECDPSTTTVTVWVYPDSYEDFRLIRDTLYQRGFLTASRPLPHGQRIGGSPEGSRSVAQ